MTAEFEIPTIEEISAELCRRSLFDFVQEFWGEIIHDAPVWNWHIPYLCQELEKAVMTVINDEPKLYDFICNICPGTTKSTLVSIMLPCWLWTRKPDCVILLNTISKTNATKFAQKRRDILTSDKYKKYFPELAIRPDSSALFVIKNTSGGEMTQYTTKGKITGDHGHVRIDDDPMSYVDAISDAEAERCIDGYKAFATRNKSLDKTVYIQVMQRLSLRDTTEHALKTLSKYKHIVLPAKSNEKVNPPELAERYVDGYLDPVRLNKKALDDVKKGLSGDEDDPMSESAFNAQYLQDLDGEEGLMYKKINEVPFSQVEFPEYPDVFSAVDPADDGSDTLGQVFAYEIGDKYFIKDVVYNANDSDENLPIMKQKYDKHRPIRTAIETNGLGSVFAKRCKEKGMSGIKPLINSENKIGRISAYKWIIEEHFYFDSENQSPEYRLFMKHLKKLPIEGSKKMVGAADVATHLAKFLFKSIKRIR